ncbi:MAG: ABC transporter substrate-binding protein [Pseudomonadota bacterium]|nr:ABC transporter substrate-binding protein [Pseudomonadota bacterium]
MNGWTLANFFGLVLGSVCVLAASTPARAESGPIRIMVSGIEKQIYLPAALAQRLGYFKEQGLDVQLRSETSGVNAEDELLTGGVQGVVGFYDHTILLQTKGKFVESVVQFSRAPGEAEVVASRLADRVLTPADFKSRVAGVTGLGSSTHLLTQFLAARHGVKPGEMTTIAVGSGAAFAEALGKGRIDMGMTTEPTVSRLLRSGQARMLVDLRTPNTSDPVLGGVYPGACLYMATVWVEGHRPQVQRLVNALVKALHYMESHRADEIAAVLPDDYYGEDRALYVEALRDSLSMFVGDGAMPATGPQTVLRVMRTVSKSVAARPVDLSKTYTTEFTSAAARQ